jgi:hypothetical protein
LFRVANYIRRRTFLPVVDLTQQDRVSNANPKQFGNSPVSGKLTNVAQFIDGQIAQKMQRLTLGAHARSVLTDKLSLERDISRPVIKQFFNCSWCGNH